MYSDVWKEFIFWGKVAGASASFIGLGYGVIRWLTSTYKKLSAIGDNVVLISTNHLPHIQASIDAHTVALQGIKGDVRDMDNKFDALTTRFEDTKNSVDDLSRAFISHIDKTAVNEDRASGERKAAGTERKAAGVERKAASKARKS